MSQVQTRLNRSLALFNGRLRAFSGTVRQENTRLQRAVSLQVLVGVVMKTPVDTGRARGGWQLDVGGFTDRPFLPMDKSGGDTIRRESANLGRLRFGGVVTIANPVVYAIYLEGGSSQQAPQGMLSLTLREVARQFRNGIRSGVASNAPTVP